MAQAASNVHAYAPRDPFAFTTEDEGILIAERAVDKLRVFLQTPDNATGGATSSGPSRAPGRAHTQVGNVSDANLALREQLSTLEDMLMMITDVRFARSLIGIGEEDENENDVGNVEVLKSVVMAVRDVMAWQTHENFDWSDFGYGGGDFSGGAPPGTTQSSGPVASGSDWTGHPVHNDHGKSSGNFPSSSLPLNHEIPSCIVCDDELDSIARRLETPCGHFYCQGCTLDLVETFTSQRFPPAPFRCCPDPHPPIPPYLVDRLISGNLRRILEEKTVEANTPLDQRIYCPDDACRQFIDPASITPAVRVAGSVMCSGLGCRVSICLECKELVHGGVSCEGNADDTQAVKIQRQFGWGRCPGCRFIVEKNNGLVSSEKCRVVVEKVSAIPRHTARDLVTNLWQK
ncbi:hypothetical protein P691DRAFT_788583 [Macrolepiota fuliginosa MF-IS2]|uniref:RING-type domain-containing protein n=1 Tax=Macrolepiota fuliginosa MF-IS2 TaxID=1400762 RepID=A0A9P6C729_9AGAR|nr:hypothetical protein P691DRAFT_788583 [Macrolepiota fuliginosa MF-IS2]